MLAIPLPFVVALLLFVLAGCVWFQSRDQAQRICWFLLACAATTFVVGLRWSFDWAVWRMLQPIFASTIPVLAWWVFAHSQRQQKMCVWHWIGPALIAIGSISYPLWQPPLDLLITLQYVGYGSALLHRAWHQPAENTRISDLVWASKAKYLAGGMLLFSALIDGAMSADFMFFEGQHAELILALGHGVLLPTLAIAVMSVGLSTPASDRSSIEAPATISEVNALSNSVDLDDIAAQTANTVSEQQLFLDPDLTLAKIARKTGVPSKRISAAINHHFQQNISQWINQQRIAYAQQRLRDTQDSVTQIYLDSGFQTKSNFHREFTRIVGMTPTQYRQP